jgi:hypothetical protein
MNGGYGCLAIIGSGDGDIIRRRYDKKSSIKSAGEGGYDVTIAGFVGANG